MAPADDDGKMAPASDDMPDLDRPVTRRELREELAAMTAELRGEFASKEDLRSFATKEDLRAEVAAMAAQLRTELASKEDLRGFATKEDLRQLNGGPPSIRNEGGPPSIRKNGRRGRRFCRNARVHRLFLQVHTRRVTDALRPHRGKLQERVPALVRLDPRHHDQSWDESGSARKARRVRAVGRLTSTGVLDHTGAVRR